jgi:hypothetical protein
MSLIARAFILAMLVFTQPALAAKVSASVDRLADGLPEIHVQNLDTSKSRYVTFYYALAHKPIVSTSARQIKIVEIKKAVTFEIASTGYRLGAVRYTVEHWSPGFNYLVVVFHDSPKFFWINTDGTIPEDPRVVHGMSSRGLSLFQFARPVAVYAYTQDDLMDSSYLHGNQKWIDLVIQ